MSDEIKAANCGCYDSCDNDNNWLIWIIIIFVFLWFVGGDNWFGGRRGCC